MSTCGHAPEYTCSACDKEGPALSGIWDKHRRLHDKARAILDAQVDVYDDRHVIVKGAAIDALREELEK